MSFIQLNKWNDKAVNFKKMKIISSKTEISYEVLKEKEFNLWIWLYKS